VYGPGRTLGPSAGPSLACEAAARNQAHTISFTGRSGFVHVDEVAAAFEAALFARLEGARVYNLWGEVADVQDVIGHIATFAPAARITASGPPLAVPTSVDSTPIYRDLPELAPVSLQEGIFRTIEHYRQTGAR
jgi:nucleoside-diphosphate-sugar epimerase